MDRETVSKWRGFNLLGMLFSGTSACSTRYRRDFHEEDFKLISELGFNFVRIPLSYRIWGSVDDPFFIDKEKLSKLDNAVEYADKYNLHICIAMHRAPGYCVNSDEKEEERLNLWHDEVALSAFKHHFGTIAERYTKIPADKLSYNIINEPSWDVRGYEYSVVCRTVIDEIRSFDIDDRYFMTDGLNWGRDPHFQMLRDKDKNIIYSCRGYEPKNLTHFGFNSEDMKRYKKPPVWPEDNLILIGGGRDYTYGEKELKRDVDLWGQVGKLFDVPIMCGEFGAYKKAPHDVVLRWMEDLLVNFKRNKIGWALWNLSGEFGVFDSNRTDITYEKMYGHSVDRKMLDLLMKY